MTEPQYCPECGSTNVTIRPPILDHDILTTITCHECGHMHIKASLYVSKTPPLQVLTPAQFHRLTPAPYVTADDDARNAGLVWVPGAGA